jgi:hypothetical protein
MVGRLEGKERCPSFSLSFEEKQPRPRLWLWEDSKWLEMVWSAGKKST